MKRDKRETIEAYFNFAFRYNKDEFSDDALRMAARYPDDLPAMQYGGILALYMADRIEEAARQLKQTARAYPEIASMLLSANPRRPALNAGFSTLGGKDEAWYTEKPTSMCGDRAAG